MARDDADPTRSQGKTPIGGLEDDRGSGRSKWIAIGVIVVLFVWMGSGFFLPGDGAGSSDEASSGLEPVAVAVRRSEAEAVGQYLRAEGQTEPQRQAGVPAQASGEIAEVLVRRGADVAAGDLIARIAPGQRQANLEQAEQDLRRAERELENAETLLDRGVGTVDRVVQARSALAAAEAQLSAAEEAIADLRITAPFAGRIERLEIEEGEFIQAGVPAAEIVDLRPLKVRIQIPQQAVGTIEEGRTAEVTVITGETREGEVVFVGSSADTETRTFEAEVEIPNEDGALPAGISARVRIPAGSVEAHFVSPAVLSLDASGTLGVKTVTDEGRVEFHAIEIVRAQTDGVWISGLPEVARVVTVGQGFVSEGEEVAARDESELGIGRVRNLPDVTASEP